VLVVVVIVVMVVPVAVRGAIAMGVLVLVLVVVVRMISLHMLVPVRMDGAVIVPMESTHGRSPLIRRWK
jgi:hypothetical protein